MGVSFNGCKVVKRNHFSRVVKRIVRMDPIHYYTG